MALPQGINFRNSAGYVTDGANEDYEIGTTLNYPRTSAQGNSVGWETGSTGYLIDTRDRNSGNDRRLAGITFEGNTNRYIQYRIDLPSAGTYNFRLAMGDASAALAVSYFELYDTSSLLSTQTDMSTSGANSFKDATGTEYTAANWPGSNTAVQVVFSTTICRLRVGATGSNFPRIAHFYIEAAGGAGPVIPVRMAQTRMRTN